MKFSKNAFDDLKALEKFVQQISKDLEEFRNHAGRRTVDIKDVELLMKRQRIVSKKKSLADVCRQYIPFEVYRDILPCVKPHIEIEKSVSKKRNSQDEDDEDQDQLINSKKLKTSNDKMKKLLNQADQQSQIQQEKQKGIKQTTELYKTILAFTNTT